MTIPRIELELVLVRHGRTKWNAEHRYLGHTDLPLHPDALEPLSELKQWLDRLTETPECDKQDFAERTSNSGNADQDIDRQEYAKDVTHEESCGQDSDDSQPYVQHSGNSDCEVITIHKSKFSGVFWRVFCSDLLRCRETLAYIAPTLVKRTVYDQRLREMNFGAWEGCTYDQLKDNPQYRSWIDDPSEVTPPNGESWEQFEERLRSFLSDLGQVAEATFGYGEGLDNKGQYAPRLELRTPIISQPKRVLIVTHGGVIRKLLAQIVPGVTFYSAAAPSPGTAMVLKIFWRDGQWSADISET